MYVIPGTPVVTSQRSGNYPRLADRVIRAKAIYSMAEGRAIYRSIAIRDEWIVAVSAALHSLDNLASRTSSPSVTLLSPVRWTSSSRYAPFLHWSAVAPCMTHRTCWSREADRLHARRPNGGSKERHTIDAEPIAFRRDLVFGKTDGGEDPEADIQA
jgi:hypothetical protein